jgi:hypothetical protein
MEESTMQISYCTQWSRHNNRPVDALTEAQARRAHEEGKLYTALLGDRQRPSCFLEFTAFRSVGVEFLDGALRTFFDYSFQEMRRDEFFMSMSHRLEFPNDVDLADRARVLYFKVDGHLSIVDYQAHADGIGSKIVGKEERVVDVSRNWEPYPKFGDYQGLATLDRGSPFLRPDRNP